MATQDNSLPEDLDFGPKTQNPAVEGLPDDLVFDEKPKTIEELSREDAARNPQSVELLPLIPKQPSEDEIKKLIKDQGALDRVVNELPQAGLKTMEVGLSPFSTPSKMVAGVFERTGSAIGALDQGKTIGQVFDAALNPEAIRKLRAIDGAPERLGELLNASWDAGPQAVMSTIVKEMTPNLRIADTFNNSDLDLIASLAPSGFQKIAKEAVKLGLDVGFDPLMYTKVLGDITPALGLEKTSAQAAEELSKKSVTQLMKEYEAASQVKRGLGADVESGRKALFQVRFPGMNAPFVVKGQKLAEALDDVGTTIESVMGVRPLMQRSGITKWDAYQNGVHPLQSVSDLQDLSEAQSKILSTGPLNENVIRYVDNVAEHGSEAGAALSKKQGVRLTADQYEQAARLDGVLSDVTERGNQAIREAGGKDLSGIKVSLPTPEEQQKLVERLSKKYGEIPALLVTDGDKTFDLTFSGGSGKYDYGRALKDEAVKARSIQQEIDGFNTSTRSSGLGMKASAEKNRVDLSTASYNALLGSKESFNPNLPEVALKKYAEKLERARELKMIDFTKKNFSVGSTAEAQELIDTAAMRVNQARQMGIAPSIDDLRFSKMTTNDFRTIDSKVYDKIKPIVADDGAVFLAEKELLYPKAIADRVEASFSAPSKNFLLRNAAELNNQWAKNVLTNPFRIGKQGVENLFKAMSLGVGFDDIMAETTAIVSKKKDAISKLADNFPSVADTVFDLKDYAKKEIPVSVKMIQDGETQAGVDKFYEILHTASKEKGTIDGVMGLKDIMKTVASSPKKALSLINDNPVSKTVRNFANGADVITKKAYFRSLIKKGYNPGEAAQMVGDHLMDFASTTNQVKDLRYVLPFASFQVKNLETLPALLAMKPGVTNIINPYDGSLKRAIEDYSGWKPEDYKAIQKAVPMYRNPILGPILRGNDKLSDNPEKPIQLLNQWAQWGLSDSQKDVLSGGLQLSMELPTNLNAAQSMTDWSRPSQTFGSPLMSIVALGLYGTDPYTGEKLNTAGTNMEGLDKLTAALRAVNPVAFPKLYNGVVKHAIEPMVKDFRQRLEDGPISRELAKVLKIQLGAETPLEKLKVDKNAIRTLTQEKFMGMGSLDSADFTYFYQQMALLRELDKTKKLIGEKATKEGRAEAYRAIDAMQETIKDINQNARIYMDYRSRAAAYGLKMKEMEPEAKDLVNRALKFSPDGQDTDTTQRESDIPADLQE